MWIPGRFTRKPASRAERLWILFSPPGWEILPLFALLIPGALLEYAALRGHALVAAIGSLAWVPILWLLLVTIHQEGRVRIWLSVPACLILHFVIGFLIVGPI